MMQMQGVNGMTSVASMMQGTSMMAGSANMMQGNPQTNIATGDNNVSRQSQNNNQTLINSGKNIIDVRI